VCTHVCIPRGIPSNVKLHRRRGEGRGLLFRYTIWHLESNLEKKYSASAKYSGSRYSRAAFPARYQPEERNASPVSIIRRKISPSPFGGPFVFLLMGSHRITGIFIYPRAPEDREMGRDQSWTVSLKQQRGCSEKQPRCLFSAHFREREREREISKR